MGHHVIDAEEGKGRKGKRQYLFELLCQVLFEPLVFCVVYSPSNPPHYLYNLLPWGKNEVRTTEWEKLKIKYLDLNHITDPVHGRCGLEVDVSILMQHCE